MWDRTIAGPPACEEWLGCGESMKVEKAEVIYGPHDRRWTPGSTRPGNVQEPPRGINTFQNKAGARKTGGSGNSWH